jgi:hypothetical protein
MRIDISDSRDITVEQVIALYRANEWSAAAKPVELHRALINSHSLITAWNESELVGLGNAISDET